MNLIQLLHLIEGFFLKIKYYKITKLLFMYFYYCLGYKNKGNIKVLIYIEILNFIFRLKKLENVVI